MPEPINVLFLCTGNSCRSQIAEGWLPLNDPAKATGTEQEIMGEFRATRNEIETRVRELIVHLRNSSPR